MKQAIMALDGGGSNLRLLITDRYTEKEIYNYKIEMGTNLSTVPNKKKALENIINLIKDGYLHIPRDYYLMGIGLSSAGTEIKENKEALKNALNEAVEFLKISSDRINDYPPVVYVTNDIDILLHSSDIAIVAGTGTVAAVKYKDITPYDNTYEIPEDSIYRFDGMGQYLGDKGSGYWIAKEVLTRVAEIETIGGFLNSKGQFIEVTDSYMRDLVLEKLFKENNIPPEEAKKRIESYLNRGKQSDYVSLVYSATTETDDKYFDRAKVGKMFSKIADEAAYAGDEAANDILKQASIELFKNIRAGYEKGNFANKENCDILLSGSVLVNSNIVRYFLEQTIQEYYPNARVTVNKEKPVWSTIKYVSKKLDEREKQSKTEEMDR